MFGLKKLERKIKALILLVLTGGVGVGGYTYRDHPIVRQLLGKAKEEAEANGIDVAKVEDAAKDALRAVAADLEKTVKDKAGVDRPGTFEVAVAAVRVDPEEFRAGHSAELDVRVIRHPARGDDSVAWEAKATARASDDTDGLLELSWAKHPFRVDWAPGDEYTIEVRDRKLLGLSEPTWFTLDLDADGGFPLRSHTYHLAKRADGKATRDPTANAIILKSHRLDDDPAPAVAEGDRRRPARR
ncbi:MAG TPA: hypothetical protein VGH33_14695 [Isosphaeraceae bacterium]|jgi:hypothetical protein